MKTDFFNGDLATDIEKHINADEPKVTKDEYFNGVEHTYCLDVNEDSYFYYNKKEWEHDYILAQSILDRVDIN